MFLKFNWINIVWALFIIGAHAIPGSSLPKVYWEIFEFDKIVHAALFGIWAFLLANGWHKQNRFFYLKRFYIRLILSICLMYALALEAAQYYIFASRAFELNDLLADIVGTVMGLGLFRALYGRYLKL
ncbi:MAG: VanZ family protein [Bacteroidetes bacterium]|nr:VanZ family protein [Bacteroidota bacterium]